MLLSPEILCFQEARTSEMPCGGVARWLVSIASSINEMWYYTQMSTSTHLCKAVLCKSSHT